MKPLNPIMAVLVIASVGATPLRTLAADGANPAVPKAVAANIENVNSINTLTRILTGNPDARKDAGVRIAEFLTEAKGGKSFLASEANEKAAKAVALAWAEKEKVGPVAMLYFVVGPGSKVPTWVKDDEAFSKAFVPDGKWEPRLRIALADWTGKSQISKAKEQGQVTAFLNDAAAKAAKVFAETRDAAQREDSILRNDNSGVSAPDLRGGAGSRLGNGTTRDYTLKDLYEDGAVVTEVYGPGDANSRKISMKIYTKRLDDGRLVNEIGIFDITDEKDIFGQRFSLGDGDQSFVLDDRKPGHKKYELKFGRAKENGDFDIAFQRPGTDKEGVALKTTANALYLARADQAAAFGRAGDVAKVGGKEFYVLPQGGALGGFVFFPKEETDARRIENPRGFAPALMAYTSERGPEGYPQRIPTGAKGGPHLGNVGGTDYHLVWNDKLTPPAWDVAEGAGDPPPAKKPGAGTGAAAGDGATTGGDGQTGQGGTGKESTIAELEALLMKAPNCRKYPNSTSEMAPELKGKYGVIMCNPKKVAEEETAIILTPLSVAQGQQVVFNSSKKTKIVHARIVGNYVVLQFDTQVQYLDIRKRVPTGFEFVAMLTGIGPEGGDKEVNGPPVEAGYARHGAPHISIVLDALRSYMSVPAKDKVFTELQKRVDDRFKGKPYELVATLNGGGLVITASEPGGANSEIWPNVVEQPKAPSPDQYAHMGGPASVFEKETSSEDQELKPSIPISQSFELVLEGPMGKDKDIALYKAVDPTDKQKNLNKYYVAFRYKGWGPKTSDPTSPQVEKIFYQKYFEAFNESAPLPEGRSMKGLTKVETPLVRGTLAYRFVGGSGKAKGVMAAFQLAPVTGEGQKDPKANCVGPLIWWGVSEPEAMKVCKEDKL